LAIPKLLNFQGARFGTAFALETCVLGSNWSLVTLDSAREGIAESAANDTMRSKETLKENHESIF